MGERARRMSAKNASYRVRIPSLPGVRELHSLPPNAGMKFLCVWKTHEKSGRAFFTPSRSGAPAATRLFDLNDCNWNESNGSPKWTEFHQARHPPFLPLPVSSPAPREHSDISFPSSVTRMISRWFFGRAPTLLSRQRCSARNRVRAAAIRILYGPRTWPTFVREVSPSESTGGGREGDLYEDILFRARRAISIQFGNCFAVVDNDAWRRTKLRHNPRTRMLNLW